MSNGKGSKRRPYDRKKWEEGYETIFGKDRFELKLKYKKGKWVMEIDDNGCQIEVELK